MKSIFITGSSGFVGKNLVPELKEKYEIFSFERNSILKLNKIMLFIWRELHMTQETFRFKNLL